MDQVATEQQAQGAPERVCVGCRQGDARDALLRFVLMGEELAPDIRRRAPGRGVSVHPRYACLLAATSAGAFKRAFKCNVAASAPHLAELARGQYARRIDGLLQACLRSRNLAVGTDAVRGVMGQGGAALLLVAEDAAGRRDEIVAQAERLDGRCVVYGHKEHLGRLLGRPSVGVVAIRDERLAEEICRAARCVAELAEDA